ncbi:hypothetical protein QBC34DRAFT_382698 [Podospora aff. communis PSN243]|uniref:Hydrophobin n=1 Tax=Podospora aff. communis PSN243 TaxID=3040156 RepID=A0AAV9GFB0_9PEZI|nr:hypothetical protein QBC34DRAFT_382698 [Podospora aff. communis PSN243]
MKSATFAILVFAGTAMAELCENVGPVPFYPHCCRSSVPFFGLECDPVSYLGETATYDIWLDECQVDDRLTYCCLFPYAIPFVEAGYICSQVDS